jgi:soluble lytic murein transglycosylase-like protein
LFRLQGTLALAVLSASFALSACSTTTKMAGSPTTSFAAVGDPVLPDSVNAIPSASGVSGDEADGMRSLAHEVEQAGAPKAASYANEAKPNQPVLLKPHADATTGEQTDTAMTVPQPEPIAPTETNQAGAMVASLAPVKPVELESVRGVQTTKPAPAQRVSPEGGVEARSSELDRLMAHYADYYGVPEALVRRVAKRESTFNPRATNGKYLGLMQISVPTARGMGYRGGRAGLLDAETNLKYAVRYLRGAFIVAGGNHDKADRLYQSGYYYHAKRAGLLDETGVGTDRKKRRRSRG